MTPLDTDDVDVPWGKYTYVLEGLATRCYLEGAAATSPRPGAPPGQKLCFRVELPSRCFVLSVAVKLPNVAESILPVLQDVCVERTLSDGSYDVVYDGYVVNGLNPEERDVEVDGGEDGKKGDGKEEEQVESPKSVDLTGRSEESKPKTPLPRKKVMEVRRAADALRLTITDMEEEKMSASGRRRSSDWEDGSDGGELRTLCVVVVGYVRGQTPASNRIKILLNSSAKLGVEANLADKAEIDGLLGLAFLGNRRYRQAAELLQRASELTLEVAREDAKQGCLTDEAVTWAAELNLLSAHAYFEHMPMSSDGIVRLVHVASTADCVDVGKKSPRDVRDLETEFLDLRTELLSMLDGLLTVLVKFLAESNSPAVRMASARMIEFVSEQLGCAIAEHMAEVLDRVLRAYPTSTTFGARERAAAASFSYDSMEDCFERLIDICCRLFPLTEHGVLKDLFDKTLIPVLLDGFQEADYLCFEVDAEEEADELMTTAVAQALRLIYLVLNILGLDATIPTALITRLLNMLIVDGGNPRTTLLLRRTALHTWDVIARALKQSALASTVTSFADTLQTLRDYLPKLLLEQERPGFEYGELEDDSDAEVEVVKEEYLVPDNSQVLQDLLTKRGKRIEIVDRHTLGRLVGLINDVCSSLQPSEEEDEKAAVEAIMSLQSALAQAIADLVMSSLIDVSYHEAAVSGNGPQESNNYYEFGDIKSQLKIVTEVLEELFEAYWAALSLLPTLSSTECVKNIPIRAVLGWCVDRMSHSAPPKGMLKLLCVVVRGLQHELNTPMYKLPAVPSSAHDVTFITIHRAHLQWFPQSVHEEAFDLMDTLNEAVSEDLMAKDITLLIDGLGDQSEKFQTRTDQSLELLANIVSASVPKRPDLAVSSLRALVDPAHGKQRIANGFPKSSRSNTGSFTRRMPFTSSAPKTDPMATSLYIHVVLASCFDKFDALGRAAKRRGGPSYMGEKIDAFVEHAALSVRCLHACARARTHREYIGAVLGDIFGTCLAMQDHGDGRVRLAGFEIFAAALDVLFLAQKAMVLVPSQPNSNMSEATVLGAGSVPVGSGVVESVNGVTELGSQGERELSAPALTTLPSDASDTGPATNLNGQLGVEHGKDDAASTSEAEDAEAKLERRMQEIYAEGGSCSFRSEETPASQLAFEERGWQMLCTFMTSSLGIGKYVDFVVQRACLEYLKGCMLNALRGRSTGASVVAFEHIEPLWDAVNRLVGSPWRTLNSLALWVDCAIVNVAIYSSVTVKGRGAARQRASQLNDFVLKEVFPKAERFLKSSIRETRIWGMQLLEAYIRARDLNSHVVHAVPPPPGRLLRCLDGLRHDWDDEVRTRSQSLLETHFSSANKKSSTTINSFTAQAQNFMSIKRNHNDDSDDSSDSSRVTLWFPALPKQMLPSQMEVYCRTLEAFANAEIEGGEETELVGAADDKDEHEDGSEMGIDDEEGYEFEEEQDVDVDEAGEEGIEGEVEEGEGLSPVAEENAVAEDDNEGESQDFEDVEGDEELPVSTTDDTEVEFDAGADAVVTTLEHSPVDIVAKPPEEPSSLDLAKNEELVDDHEFSPAVSKNEPGESNGAILVTQVSDNEDDDLDAATSAVRVSSSDDDVEEDEVFDVTDEEDVFADLDSGRQGAAKDASQNRSQVDKLASKASSDGARKDGNRPGSPPRPLRSLNPDLDEGVQVLRRKGSFTSRSGLKLPSEGGDAPRLARRRSHEVSSIASIIDAGNENRLGQQREDGPASWGELRLSRRKSMKSPASSPRGADSARSKAADDAIPEKNKDGSNEGQDIGDSVNSGSGRLVRRKSAGKGLGLKLDDEGKSKAADDAKDLVSRKQHRESGKDAVVGGAFLSLSPKGARVPRGVKLDDDLDDTFEPRPRGPVERSGTGDSAKARSEGKSGSRPNRRSLPRAPAFLKGVGPQRRLSGGIPSITISTTDRSGDSSTGSGSGTSPGNSSSSTASGGSARSKLPRARSLSNRPSRLDMQGGSDGDTTDKKDRSHRYGKRAPLNLSFEDESEELDKDLLGELGPSLDGKEDLRNQMRVSTPTAEALKGRNTLADDSPNSGYNKRRGSNRNVFDSKHYKGLLDQIGAPVDDSPRSESSSGSPHRIGSREGDKGVSPSAQSDSSREG